MSRSEDLTDCRRSDRLYRDLTRSDGDLTRSNGDLTRTDGDLIRID